MSCNGTGYVSYTRPQLCQGCHDCQGPDPAELPRCDRCGDPTFAGELCAHCGFDAERDYCSECGTPLPEDGPIVEAAPTERYHLQCGVEAVRPVRVQFGGIGVGLEIQTKRMRAVRAA